MPLIHGSRERDWPQEGPRRVISPCEFTGCRVGISSRRSWLGELDKQLKERNKACRCGKGIFIVFLPDGRRTESRDSRSCMSRRLAPDCLTAASLTKVRSTPSGATPPLDNHTRKPHHILSAVAPEATAPTFSLDRRPRATNSPGALGRPQQCSSNRIQTHLIRRLELALNLPYGTPQASVGNTTVPPRHKRASKPAHMTTSMSDWQLVDRWARRTGLRLLHEPSSTNELPVRRFADSPWHACELLRTWTQNYAPRQSIGVID